MEFSPYDSSRFFVTGPDIQLSRKLAIVLALMFHELATNAAKYGALSNIDGRVAVSWKIQQDRVRLEWAEQGGPEVLEPRRRGFGRALLEHGLVAYGGTVELFFVPSGLSCRLSLSASECGPLKSLAA
jgi:two-component sensor histidine kinase